MRLLLGMILGALLLAVGAYVHDRSMTATVADRPLVNWDVVDAKWNHLSARARAEYHKLRATI